MVIFTSSRSLERSENIKVVWDAYKGQKQFIRLRYDQEKQLENNKFDLVVTDEFVPRCISPMIMIFHGAEGIKTYGFDQPHPYHSRNSVEKYLYFVISTSKMIDLAAEQCGVSKDKILPLGMPRTDQYFGNLKRDITILPENKKVYLYVPTFQTLTERNTDWLKIDKMLTDDEIFLIKNHMVTGDPHIPNDNLFKHIKIISCSFQSAPFLIGCDSVITDYSSIMIDAHILNKPVVLYAKDKNRYLKIRGMYYDYPDAYSSQFTSDEEELIHMLRNPINNSSIFKNFFADACDGHSTERVVKLIERSII